MILRRFDSLRVQCYLPAMTFSSFIGMATRGFSDVVDITPPKTTTQMDFCGRLLGER